MCENIFVIFFTSTYFAMCESCDDTYDDYQLLDYSLIELKYIYIQETVIQVCFAAEFYTNPSSLEYNV